MGCIHTKQINTQFIYGTLQLKLNLIRNTHDSHTISHNKNYTQKKIYTHKQIVLWIDNKGVMYLICFRFKSLLTTFSFSKKYTQFAKLSQQIQSKLN